MSYATHFQILKPDGSVWGSGTNGVGALGDNSITERSSPVAVVGGHSFIQVTTGDGCTLARKASGEVWGWGNNVAGQLGNNTTLSTSSPVLVVGNHSFISISCDEATTLALKADGSVWGWGSNDSGQIGDLTTGQKSSPVLVAGGHSFIEIAAGSAFSSARKANGEVWTWGNNQAGSLGDNTVTGQSSPVLVCGNHSFVQIAATALFMFARKSSGEVWAWGAATWGGNLGIDADGHRSSPVLVAGNHSFIDVATGYSHTFALKSDGTAWAWGSNDYAPGSLGDGTRTDRSSPVPVVGGHSFIEVLAHYAGGLGLKANGEVWSWGLNLYGTVGDNTLTDKSSPVLVVGSHSFYTLSNRSYVDDLALTWSTDYPDASPSMSVSPSSSESLSPSVSASTSPSSSGSVSPSTSPSGAYFILDDLALEWVEGEGSESPSVSSSLSPSVSGSQSASISPSPSATIYTGATWGEQNPDAGEEARPWSEWNATVQGDASWGRMEVPDGTPCVGPVVEMGNTNAKTITAQVDKYETGGGGTGVVRVWVRGSETIFSRND